MKKTNKLGMLIILACLAIATTAPANMVPDSAICVDLVAGQSQTIGQVCVWNDADNLYVEFLTVGGWEMTETHLDVGASLEDIHTNKKGNPIPGQFAYAHENLGGVLEDLYTIPLQDIGVGSSDTLFIAAHIASGYRETLTVMSGAGAAATQASGPLDHYAGLASTDWLLYSSAEACWVHGSWPSITGATWVSTAYYVEAPYSANSWRKFLHVIDIPGWPISAVITATSDNAEEVYLNAALVGSDGEVQGVFHDDHEWETIIGYTDDGTNLLPGQNNLEFIVRNYAGTNSQTGNPTGLIYKAEIEYYASQETAWGEGNTFPGANNWGMYFTYTIQERRWDIAGTWELLFVYGNDYPHEMLVTVYDVWGDGIFIGTGESIFPHPTPGQTWTVAGLVVDDAVMFTIDYDYSTYYVDVVGTIASDGTMSGNWENLSQSGTYMTQLGAATPVWGPPWP